MKMFILQICAFERIASNALFALRDLSRSVLRGRAMCHGPPLLTLPLGKNEQMSLSDLKYARLF